MTQPDLYTSTRSDRTNVLSIVSLVTGILMLGIVPVICGHISLNQIRKTGEQGKVMAIIGLVLGYIELAFYALALLFFVIGIVALSQNGGA